MSESKDMILSDAGQLTVDVPDYIKAAYGEDDSGSDLITSLLSAPKLSTKGKQFRYIDDKGDERKLALGEPIRVVFLTTDPKGKDLAKSYYEDSYDPDTNEPPTCSSVNGHFPDPFITSPQHANCTQCPKNAFGSGTNDKGQATKGKACADTKLLFVVLADMVDGPIMCLRVAVTSLKALTSYGKKLVAHKMPMSAVITELTFDEDTDWPQLNFNALGWLPPADADSVKARSESVELQQMLPSLNQGAEEARESDVTPVAAIAPPAADVPPPPPAAEPVRTMTEAAGDLTYESYVKAGWNDEQMIAANLMTIGA